MSSKCGTGIVTAAGIVVGVAVITIRIRSTIPTIRTSPTTPTRPTTGPIIPTGHIIPTGPITTTGLTTGLIGGKGAMHHVVSRAPMVLTHEADGSLLSGNASSTYVYHEYGAQCRCAPSHFCARVVLTLSPKLIRGELRCGPAKDRTSGAVGIGVKIRHLQKFASLVLVPTAGFEPAEVAL